MHLIPDNTRVLLAATLFLIAWSLAADYSAAFREPFAEPDAARVDPNSSIHAP